VNQKTALISYAQNGQFNYTTYLKPSNLTARAADNGGRVRISSKVVGTSLYLHFPTGCSHTSGTARVEAVLEIRVSGKKRCYWFRIPPSAVTSRLISRWTSATHPDFHRD